MTRTWALVGRSALVAGLAATCLATVSAAGARTSTGQRNDVSASADAHGAQSRPAADADNKFGIPPISTTDPFVEGYAGIGAPSAQATKLKTTIAVPASRLLSYLSLCTQVIQLGSDDPANCPDFHPPTTDFDSFDNEAFPIWILASGPVWVQSPAGSRLPYGSFPSVRVHILAFGAIPATATVTITQPVGRDGFVEPLQVKYLTPASPLPRAGGAVFANKYWPGFTFPAGDGNLRGNVLFTTSGHVDVRVSDVQIDGRPLDVGPSCHTSTPGTITIASPPGFYDGAKTSTELRGRPGGAQILSNTDAGSAQGSVSIPAFTGCGDGQEDLDPLITNFVSGPDNPVDVAFTQAFFACSNPNIPTPCPEYPRQAPSSVTPAQVRAADAVPAKVAALWQKLTPGARSRLVRSVAHLPALQRGAVLKSLPPQAATAVRAARH